MLIWLGKVTAGLHQDANSAGIQEQGIATRRHTTRACKYEVELLRKVIAVKVQTVAEAEVAATVQTHDLARPDTADSRTRK